MSQKQTITLVLYGVPKPGGSKKAIPRIRGYRPGGKPILGVLVFDDAKGNDDWKNLVKFTAKQRYPGRPLDGPLLVRATLFMPRPRRHFGTGKNRDALRSDAPRHPTTKPDTTKLWRSTEDALTGVLWHDDAQIVAQYITKEWATKARQPGVTIVVETLPETGDLWS